MRALFCSLVVLLLAGHAAAQDPSTALRTGACHVGVIEEGAIRWVSRVHVGRDPVVVPRELEIERIEGGRLGPDSTLLASPGHAYVRVTSRQQLLDRDHVVLRVPRAHGAQRITLAAGSERVRFEPELDGPLERHVGYVSTNAVSEARRRSLDSACGAAPARSLSIFVDGEHAQARGAISTLTERRVPFEWLGAGLFVVLLGLGGFAYRTFGRRAAIERAEALIEERFAELETAELKPPSSRP